MAVWNIESNFIFGEIPVLGDIGTAINGVTFLDNKTILVAPQGGGPLLRFTIDPAQLFDIASNSPNRGFSDTDCATYDIDPCPTLEEMRSG